MPPDKENCKKLRKDTMKQASLYMGTLSLAEAEAMRSTCYPDVSAEVVRTRHAKFGGIARYLFRPLLANNTDGALNAVKKQQLAALNIIAENPLCIDAGEVTSQFKSLWSLYHVQPRKPADGGIDYFDYTIELCCDDARFRIRETLMEKEVQDLWNIYKKTNEQYGTLRGMRYEAYAHKRILIHGIQGTAISLTSKGEGTSSIQVTIPARTTKVTLSSNDLGAPFENAVRSACLLPAGRYLLPETSNFHVADFCLSPPLQHSFYK